MLGQEAQEVTGQTFLEKGLRGRVGTQVLAKMSGA